MRIQRSSSWATGILVATLAGCGTDAPVGFGSPSNGAGPDASTDAMTCTTCGSGADGSSAGPGGPGSGGSSGGGAALGDSGSRASSDGGGPVDVIGPKGGTLSSLSFAVVGDTRPATIDDTSGYPTAVITKIFQDVTAYNPVVPFGVSTGDYMFATPQAGGQAKPQLDLYLQARGAFPMFPAMGNHECTGATVSNCGPSGTDGITDNYTQFIDGMMQPLGNTVPYYSIEVDAVNGSWTAKFVFVAANAWDAAQASWLQTAMGHKTTYTFVVRHESSETSGGPPGESGSDSIISQFPYTLLIVGHTHTYEKGGAKEVIVGNGGAPLTGGVDYGFGLVTQRSDGAVQFDMIDYMTLQPDTSFRFAVNPDGSAAP